MTRFIILVGWLLSFAVLNYATKRLTMAMPPLSGGLWAFALYLAGSLWAYVMVGLYVACAGLYLAAVKVMPLSTAGPLFLVMGILATCALAVVIFGEGVSILKGVGIALAVVGVVLIQWQGSEAAP